MVSFASAMKPILLTSLTTYVFVGPPSESVLPRGSNHDEQWEHSIAAVGTLGLRITTKPGDAVDLNPSSLWQCCHLDTGPGRADS